MVHLTTRSEALSSLYLLLDELAERCGGHRRLAVCHGRMGWPQRGIYFFFEDGELRDDGITPRVVRVGTHALRASNSTLWGRLRQHRGGHSGGGDHRGSVFRLHVGKALINLGGWSEEISRTWGIGRTAPREIRLVERPLEESVSMRIGQMPFLWIGVDDEAGPASKRGLIERAAISLLSNLSQPPIDSPSSAWLGRVAANESIRLSGLWNVNHVREASDASFLRVLRTLILATP